MTGYEEFNFPAFDHAAFHLRSEGWDVFSPHENGVIEDGTLADYMVLDLPMVCKADAVFVLKGWEESKGAAIETIVAQMLGKPIYTYPDGLEVTSLFGVTDKLGNKANHAAAALIYEAWEKPPATPERHPNSARFHELLGIAGDTHDRKQSDYGKDNDPFANVRASENWGIPGWVGALVRLNDKVARLQSFARKGSLANESAQDSMMDIAVYALIALCLYEEASA